MWAVSCLSQRVICIRIVRSHWWSMLAWLLPTGCNDWHFFLSWTKWHLKSLCTAINESTERYFFLLLPRRGKSCLFGSSTSSDVIADAHDHRHLSFRADSFFLSGVMISWSSEKIPSYNHSKYQSTAFLGQPKQFSKPWTTMTFSLNVRSVQEDGAGLQLWGTDRNRRLFKTYVYVFN